MDLRSRWKESETVRRSVIGAIAGAVAGITAVSIEGSLVEQYGVALLFGAIVFIALRLLVE
jgi:hypothetical protein